jgi:hypothetical protein
MSAPKRYLEGDYQRAFLARAAVEFPGVRFFRRNTGAITLEGRVFRAGIPGQCDLYVLGRGGWHGELEVKRYGSLTPEQERWRDWCIEWGVPWECVRVRRGTLGDESPAATVDRWVKEVRTWLDSTMWPGL